MCQGVDAKRTAASMFKLLTGGAHSKGLSAIIFVVIEVALATMNCVVVVMLFIAQKHIWS